MNNVQLLGVNTKITDIMCSFQQDRPESIKNQSNFHIIIGGKLIHKPLVMFLLLRLGVHQNKHGTELCPSFCILSQNFSHVQDFNCWSCINHSLSRNLMLNKC